MKTSTIALLTGFLVLLAAVIFLAYPRRLAAPSPSPTSQATAPLANTTPPPARLEAGRAVQQLNAAQVSGADSAFQFTAAPPQAWAIEAVPATQALNLYDPSSPGENDLEKSQIFIRSFTAKDFLTLSTVTIWSQSPRTIAGRPAIRYEIEKKPSAASFAGQPAWRNFRHVVTDVRASDANPSVFYVIAKRPDVDEAVYQEFLDSFSVGQPISLVEPVADWLARITTKPFGLYISPATSPVQPERFTGYHTGVDVEYADAPGEVSIHAVAAGTVVTSGHVNGYGGVIVLEHQSGQPARFSLYGHLDPASLLAIETNVASGERLGVLGEDNTRETDGERKHLHFALLQTDHVDLRGYVANPTELSRWRDPVLLYN